MPTDPRPGDTGRPSYTVRGESSRSPLKRPGRVPADQERPNRGKALYETYRRIYNGPTGRSGLAVDSPAVPWRKLKPKFQRVWNELHDALAPLPVAGDGQDTLTDREWAGFQEGAGLTGQARETNVWTIWRCPECGGAWSDGRTSTDPADPLRIDLSDPPECGCVGVVMVPVEVVPASERDRLRAGLLACATEAGEDVSDGIPTTPDVVEWAVRAVRETRAQAEDEEARLVVLSDRLAGEVEQLREALANFAVHDEACDGEPPETWDARHCRVCELLAPASDENGETT